MHQERLTWSLAGSSRLVQPEIGTEVVVPAWPDQAL